MSSPPKRPDFLEGKKIYFIGGSAFFNYQKISLKHRAEIERHSQWAGAFTANTAEDALKIIRKEKPDAVIIHMPGIAITGHGVGLDVLIPFLQELKKAGIKALVTDTVEDNVFAAQITAAGAVYVDEPLPLKITAKIETMLDPRNAEKQLK